MKRPRFGGLIKNAAALMISSAVSAIIGLVFWGAATHLTSAATVGRNSAEVAALSLLGLLSQLSYGSIFERFIPVAGARTRSFVTRAYVLCGSVALVLSLAYVLLGIGHRFLPSSLTWRAFFVVSVILWTIFGLQDSALVGLRSSRWVPVENISYSLAKLALLPLFIMWSASQGIFVAWMFPVVWLIIAVNWYMFKKRIPEHQARSSASEKLPTTRQLVALSGAQYASLLITVLTSSITTLIVIDRLGAVANAYYYIPGQISLGAVLALGAIMRSFLVEAASEPSSLAHFVRTTLRVTVILLLPAMVFGLIFAPQILDVFGRSYSEQGTTLLRMLLLSLPAIAVTSFYSSFAWLDQHVWWFAIREVASAVIFFGVFLTLLGHFGIRAIGIGSLVESGVQGFFFLPILIKRYRLAVNGPVPTG
jgi:O-antigen/teichoic acid export membrane protein